MAVIAWDCADEAYREKAYRSMALEIERLRKALVMARARIEYLGAACTDPRHFEANRDIVLPKIDAALTDGSRETCICGVPGCHKIPPNDVGGVAQSNGIWPRDGDRK